MFQIRKKFSSNWYDHQLPLIKVRTKISKSNPEPRIFLILQMTWLNRNRKNNTVDLSSQDFFMMFNTLISLKLWLFTNYHVYPQIINSNNYRSMLERCLSFYADNMLIETDSKKTLDC